jgi:cell division protein FtsA
MTPRKPGNRSPVVGLDVGTTKICAIAGKQESGKVKIMSVEASPSHGLRKGIVVDMDMTSQSIRATLTSTEQALSTKIRSVVVGIAGGHIKGFNGYGAIGIKGGRVREEDVDRLIDSAGAVYVPVDREILHVLPAGFRLDGQNSIQDPVGMSGERLEARLHIVTGSVTSVQNLILCCERAGVEVKDIVLEPLASADAVLTAEERERGVVLIDIGGGTTDIAVYKKGTLRHTAVLALGGNHITNDIAVGLGIPVLEAERIKKVYGDALAEVPAGGDDILVSGMDGKARKVSGRHLSEVIRARCEELMILVKKEIGIMAGGFGEETEFPPRFSGVVLTGGTSLLRSLGALAEFVVGLPVRIGIPGKVENNALVESPEYATGVGLVQYGLDQRGREDDLWSQEPSTSGGIFERMKYWVKGYFT